jgi:hypothetical protein
MSVLKLLALLFLIPALAYGAGFNAESLTASKYLTVGSGTQTAAALSVKGQGVGMGFAVRVADSSAVDRLVVLDNGNVGVGTTAPVVKLDVVGNIKTSGGIVSSNMVYDVRNYGAVGNDSTDDAAAIQAAINDAVATGNGTGIVYLPSKTFKVTTSIQLYSGIRLIGTGTTPTITGSKIHMTGDAPAIIVNGDTGNGFEISNLSIVGNVANTSNDGISLQHGTDSCRYSSIHDVFIYQVGRDAIRLDGFDFVDIKNCNLWKYVVCGINAIDVDSSSPLAEFLVVENVICNGNAASGTTGMRITDGAYVTLIGNDFDTNDTGLYVGEGFGSNLYAYSSSILLNNLCGIEINTTTNNSWPMSFYGTNIFMKGTNATEYAINIHSTTYNNRALLFSGLFINKNGATPPTTCILADSLLKDSSFINVTNDAGGLFSFPNNQGIYLHKLVNTNFIEDTTGNIGIGTTSPTNRLYVNYNYNALNLPTTISSYALAISNQSTTTGDGAGMGFSVSSTPQSVGAAITHRRMGSSSAGDLTFWTKAVSGSLTENMTLGGTGNLGIGTTTPMQKLDISGTVQMTGFKMAVGATNGQVLTTDAAGVGTWQTPSATASVTYDSQTINTNPSGQLRIIAGTGSDGQVLKMSGANVEWGTVGGGTASAGGSVHQLQYNYPSGTIAGTPLMVYDTSTNNLAIGVGTTNNGSKLYLRGNGLAEGFVLRIADSTPSDKVVIMDNGNVGIGTTTPLDKVQIIGNLDIGNTLSSVALLMGSGRRALNIIDSAGVVKIHRWDASNAAALEFMQGNTGTIGAGSGQTRWWDIAVDSSGFSIRDRSDSGANKKFWIQDASQNWNVGIGTTAPNIAKLGIRATGATTGFAFRIVDSNFADKVTILDNGNLGIATTAPTQKLEIIGTGKMTDIILTNTQPLMSLSIINPDASMDGIGKVLSTSKDFQIDAIYAQCPNNTTGTSVEFTLKTVGPTGTGSTSNLTVGQTAPVIKLTVAGSSSMTIPAGQLMVLDTVSLTGGSSPLFRLDVFGHEK